MNEALDAYLEGDSPRMMAALLRVWRECRDFHLGDAIIALSQGSGPVVDEQPSLLEGAALEHWVRSSSHPGQAMARLDRLKRRYQPDPRLSALALKLLKPRLFSKDRDFQTGLWKLLRAQKDPAVLSRLDAVEMSEIRYDAAGGAIRLPGTRQHNRRISALQLKAGTPGWEERRLDAAAAKVLEQIMGSESSGPAKTTKQRRALWKAVVQSPGELAPRLVWADYLAGESDPRADFIQLQAIEEPTELQTSRLTGLFELGRQRWLHEVVPVLDLKLEHMKWGYLHEIVVDASNPTLRATAGGSHEWHLVRKAHLKKSEHVRVLLDGSFKSLRQVSGVTNGQDAAMLSVVHPHLRRLSFQKHKTLQRPPTTPCNFTSLRRLLLTSNQVLLLPWLLSNAVRALDVLQVEVSGVDMRKAASLLKSVRDQAGRTELVMRARGSRIEVHTRRCKGGGWEFAFKLRGGAEVQLDALATWATERVVFVQSTQADVRKRAGQLWPDARVK